MEQCSFIICSLISKPFGASNFSEKCCVITQGRSMFPLPGLQIPTKEREVTMNCFELLYEPLAVEPILEKVKSPDCGAVSIFVGTARNNFNGREVISLHYEAYPKMAHKEFMDICREIRSRWRSIVHIAVQHRLGEVSVSENIVTVALSSPHRSESLSAMTFILDKLKERVPIWKKENYKDASGVWKENTECVEARTPCT